MGSAGLWLRLKKKSAARRTAWTSAPTRGNERSHRRGRSRWRARRHAGHAPLRPTGYDGQPSRLRGAQYADPSVAKVGGAKGSRTPDLLNAIQALSQLSYGPN